MTTERKCPICGKALSPERRLRYPVAILCGADSCTVDHARNRSKVNQQRLRDDYFTWRRATGKTQAKGAPVATQRGPIDSKPPEPAWGLIAAFLAPVKLVQRVLRRRRDRKEHRAWTEFLTRQGRMK